MCCFRKFLFCERARWTLHVFCKCLLSPVRAHTHTHVYILCCLPLHPRTHVQVIYVDLSMDFKLVYTCSTQQLVPERGKNLVQNPKGQHVRMGVKKPKPAWTRFLVYHLTAKLFVTAGLCPGETLRRVTRWHKSVVRYILSLLLLKNNI